MKCYVLAGGRSRRFGTDKLLYPLFGVPVVERVVKTARSFFEEVYLVAKEEEKFAFLGVPVLRDALPESASAVGLYTALLHAESPAFVLSGDLPLVKRELFPLLIEAFEEPATVARTGEKLHPLVGVYGKEFLPFLEKKIKEKDYRLTAVLKEAGFKEVEVKPPLDEALLNLNRPEDLRKVLTFEKDF